MRRIIAMLDPRRDDAINASQTNVVSSIITAKTQVGKTASIINMLLHSQGWLSVLSCDNKIDQMLQLKQRLEHRNVNVYQVSVQNKLVKKVAKHLENNENVVLIMLNNHSQISRLTRLIGLVKNIHRIKKYLCIHDEADMVNKSDELVETDDEKMPASHKEWIAHFKTNVFGFERIRRIWVTATCENCSNLQHIKARDIEVLPTPSQYRAINAHTTWNGDDDNEALLKEISRIRKEKSGEVILYCHKTLIKDQQEMAEALSRTTGCISVVYNSTGKTIFGHGRNPKQSEQTIDALLLTLSYSKRPVVIFGSELMGRGMSFVGRGSKPLAATVMFHKDTASTTAVNMTQKFGRITGTARPDLTTRRIYCTDKAYSDYKVYLKNQEEIYKVLEEHPELNMTEILKLIESDTMTRKVDRPALKQVNKDYKVNSEYNPRPDVQSNSQDNNEDKMKRLVEKWKNPENNADIARLFRAMIAEGGKMLSDTVKEILKNEVPLYTLTNSRHTTTSWYLIFEKNETCYSIKQEAKNYYETL